MNLEDSKQARPKIEITPEMISVGAQLLRDQTDAGALSDLIAKEVFEAMLALRKFH